MNNVEAKYVPLRGFVVPCYRYLEGDEFEEFWVDCQNCGYNTFMTDSYDDETGLYNGKKWWIIFPCVPEGLQEKVKKNNEQLKEEDFKWVVEDSSEEGDVDWEWDFQEHKIRKNGIKIVY